MIKFLFELYCITSLLCSCLIWFCIVNARDMSVEVLSLDVDRRLYTTVRILTTAPLMLFAGL